MSTTTAAPNRNPNETPGMPTAGMPTMQKFLVVVPFVDRADGQPDFKTFIAEAASLDDAYARFQVSLADKNWVARLLFEENYDPEDDCQEGYSLLDEPLNWYVILPVDGIAHHVVKYEFVPI